jgi:Ca2+-binding EF-hand superfamily protein
MTQSPVVQFAEILDIDGDGIIQPLEAADAIEMMYEEEGVGIRIDEIEELVEEHQIYMQEEVEWFIEDFDMNTDGVLKLSELPEDLQPFAAYSDLNKDGVITIIELMEVNPESDEVFAMVEIDEIYADLDENDDGQIEMEVFVEDDEEFAKLVAPFDTNNDNMISRDEMIAGYAILDAPVSFDVQGDSAMMHGTIGASTPFRVMELVYYHPEVKTIVMMDVPGSVDDDSSLRASRMVRSHGLNTYVPSSGEVASGGTDFFQAGVERTCGKGAKFGVHSWSEFGAEGTDYPRDDEVHSLYLDYCDDMGIPQSFYWYTLEIAPADDIHYMTEEELSTYNMLTAPINPE